MNFLTDRGEICTKREEIQEIKMSNKKQGELVGLSCRAVSLHPSTSVKNLKITLLLIKKKHFSIRQHISKNQQTKIFKKKKNLHGLKWSCTIFSPNPRINYIFSYILSMTTNIIFYWFFSCFFCVFPSSQIKTSWNIKKLLQLLSI